ncbi:hypothetical protein, partial [Reyranella sp.]|uniref:hypothetical protein n=1 Tax=Reyranella sp. TaxID=1929291 RepID=UPI0040373303
VMDRPHLHMQTLRQRDPVPPAISPLKHLKYGVAPARRKAAREDSARKKGMADQGHVEEIAEEAGLDPAEADQPDLGER